MKKQQGKLLLKRDKLRHHLIMTRIKDIKNQTYQKIMGQKSNGKINQPFNQNEIDTLTVGITEVIEVCQDFIKEINTPD